MDRISQRQTRTPWLAAPAAGLILALGLAWAPPAPAAVTESSVTEPSVSPLYSIIDEDAPPPYKLDIQGTTNSTEPLSDSVDVGCFTNFDHAWSPIYLGAPLDANGDFSVAAEAGYLANKLCHVLAVPSGGAPADRSPFSGPTTAIGRARTERIETGPNTGTPDDFFLYAQQLGGGEDYYSLSSCGLGVARLFTPGLESPTTTFSCSDWYAGFDETDTAHSSRSEIQVDGADAYAAYAAAEAAPETSGIPAISWAYGQSPGSGDTTITESAELSTCPGQAYPPDSCPAFAASGVRDERRIEQGEEGRLVTITDRFSSSDGQPHSLDLLSQQGARLGNFPANEVAYRFPGQSGFAVHASGETVSFDSGGPGIVYLRVPGAPDGDPETGQAAIVFDRPSSPARFNTVFPEESSFHLHQAVAVPASGTATVRFAYVQGFTAAEVEAQAQAAFRSFGGGAQAGGQPAGGGPQPAPPATTQPRPSNAFRLAARRLDRHRGTAVLTLAVPGPGRLVLAGSGVKRVNRPVAKAGRVTVPVVPARALAGRLKRSHRARVHLRLTFTPRGGTSRTRSLILTLLREGGR